MPVYSSGTDRLKAGWVEKGKVRPRTGNEGPEGESSYSSTISLTSALDRGGWLMPRPGRFTPGNETRYTFYRRLGGPQGQLEGKRAR